MLILSLDSYEDFEELYPESCGVWWSSREEQFASSLDYLLMFDQVNANGVMTE
jgi:hypothetical protein